MLFHQYLEVNFRAACMVALHSERIIRPCGGGEIDQAREVVEIVSVQEPLQFPLTAI
jgi:hypothetical protein